MKSIFCFYFGFLLFVTACQKDNQPGTGKSDFTVGKNRFTIRIDGDDRKYFVHIPKSYTGTSTLPVAFMLHGTSGDGERFYTISGWKEIGESENIITVFPSSWRYCITDPVDGPGTTTKWNTVPDADWTFCNGQIPRDDIKFLNAIISDLDAKYNIDMHRIYLSGFSNGGQMAAKCSIDMSDKFAAIAENAGSFYIDKVYTPKRKLPIIFQVGNMDYGPDGTGPTIPLSKLDYLLSPAGQTVLNGRHYGIAQRHINDFMLNPNYTMSEDTTSARIANYTPSTPSTHEFHFILVSGLDHQYPNGINHPMTAARVHWEWMKQFTKP